MPAFDAVAKCLVAWRGGGLSARPTNESHGAKSGSVCGGQKKCSPGWGGRGRWRASTSRSRVAATALAAMLQHAPLLSRLLAAAAAPAAAPFVLLGLALALLALRLYRQAYERPHNFPPGPPRLPIWGSYWLVLWQNYRFLHRGLWALAQRYKTSIMGFYLGQFPCVLLTQRSHIKEMQDRPEFAGRADIIVTRERSFGGRHGVIFSDGAAWGELKRFTQRYMRDFGWGRRFEASEAVMAEEIRDMVDLLRGDWADEEVCRDGKVLTSELIFPFALNAVWSIFGGRRLPRGQHGPLRRIGVDLTAFTHKTDPSGGAVSMTPWLRFFTPRRFGLRDVEETNVRPCEFVKNAIDEHKATFDEGHLRDFIDRFLLEMKNTGGEKSDVFSDDQLFLAGVDMVTATVGALSTNTAFLCQQLLHFPEVQRRIQEEVNAVVGRCRQPTLDDRQHMPYTEATVREALRRVSQLPLSIAHVAMEDTTFQGYNIPKGTLLYAHLDRMHMDPDLWGDPENFRPERFLESDGRLTKKDLSFPFGGGKRLCPGETFSRHMLFLFLAHLMQGFTLLPAGPGPLPPLDAALNGFTLVPPPLWARFEPCH